MAYPVNSKCQHGIDANVVALWHMNEASWDGTPDEVKDASGNNLHGAAVGGVSTATGKFGRCGDFDGAGKYVATAFNPYTHIGNTNPFTVEFWVYLRSYVVDYSTIWSNDSSVPNRFYFHIRNTGNPFVGLGDYYTETSGVGITLNTWQYYVETYDGANIKVYLNAGTPWDSGNQGAKNYGDDEMNIGSITALSQRADGLIDEVRISDIARSPENLYQHYHQQVGNHII